MKYTTIDDCKTAIEKIEKRDSLRDETIRGHIEAVKSMWTNHETPKFHPYYELICDNS